MYSYVVWIGFSSVWLGFVISRSRVQVPPPAPASASSDNHLRSTRWGLLARGKPMRYLLRVISIFWWPRIVWSAWRLRTDDEPGGKAMAHVVEVEVAKLGLGHSVLERCADVARRPDAALTRTRERRQDVIDGLSRGYLPAALALGVLGLQQEHPTARVDAVPRSRCRPGRTHAWRSSAFLAESAGLRPGRALSIVGAMLPPGGSRLGAENSRSSQRRARRCNRKRRPSA
jgi:hypothetical protein